MSDEPLTHSADESEIQVLAREMRAGFAGVGQRLAGIDARLDGIDGHLDGIDGHLDGIDGRLDGIDARLDGIDGRLDGVEGRLDGVEVHLDGIDGRLSDSDDRFATIMNQIEEQAAITRSRFEAVAERMEHSVQVIAEATAVNSSRVLDHESRLRRLEGK